jgi:predicted CXXCH cytochrome family protein
MSRSVGRVEGLAPGAVTNQATRTRYDVSSAGGDAWLTATKNDGGTRRQRIVGRIGAGIFDRSWVTSEVDAAGAPTGRLFFAPVETVAGHGLELAPFDVHSGSPGMDMPMTRDCLTCHTLDVPPSRFPPNQFAPDGFSSMAALGCPACHGSVDKHAAIMRGNRGTSHEGLGIARLARLAPAAQRDVCARCHLQGDARIDLVNGNPDRSRPLASQIPVLVPARGHADFRFVGQLERLALSACFKASPAMTCTTCHDPHTGVRAQGVESFDRACVSCHKTLTTTTEAAHASMTGCSGCHVRRSQPFDLPHVTTADHFIRRRIQPAQAMPHRQFADREGPLDLYDDGRLHATLQTAAGRRWKNGVLAMGLLTMGRFKEAARLLEAFPAPGSPAARAPAAPEGLTPLETLPAFHTVRGFVLMGNGRVDDARRAFSDAIAIDPAAADARLARARINFDTGDLRGALLDTETVIRAWPQAEQPWDLRIEIAMRSGRPDLALTAADASTRLWPSNPRTWATLALLARQRGETERAQRALERARALSPGAVARSPNP